MDTQLTLSEVKGLLHDLNDKLSGSNGSEWFSALKRFLRKENPWEGKDKFSVWRTLKLGTGLKTANDFRGALNSQGCKISDWAGDILGQPAFTASDIETEVDLVNVSVAELGFKKGATRADIYKRALELGLELCPAEVGPQLRLQYKDQPRGEWLRIGMEPLADSDGYPNVFDVVHGVGELWLYGLGHPGYFWRGDNRFVFVRRK